MKRLFHLLVILIVLLSTGELFASNLDDLLRDMESPEVDYHVDEDIKTIVIQPKPIVKQAEKKSESVENKENSSYTKQESSDKKNIKKESDPKVADSSSDKDSKSNSKKDKNTLNDIASKIIKETTKPKNDKSNLAKSKSNTPIKIYSLFMFFKKMAFIQTWQNNIIDNLAFCKLLTDDVFDFWQAKYEEEEEEKEEEEEENEDDSEEETPIDYSKFTPIFAQAQTLCESNKWDEVITLFEENEEASEVPEAQKFLLLAELNNPNKNINRLKSLGSRVLETDANDPNANYALAIYHFKTKKKDVKKASKFIEIALKSKNPPKGAVELSKEINSSGFATYAIILIAILAAVIIFVIKKKKSKSAAANESPEKTGEEQQNEPKSESNLSQKLAPLKAKLEPIITKLRPLFDKSKAAISNVINKLRKKKQVEIDISVPQTPETAKNEEEVEEVIVEVDEDGNEIVVEEVLEDDSGDSITEEIIEEEIVEDSPNSSNQEIVEEEIIEEIENEPAEEEVEEVIEEEEEVIEEEEEVIEEEEEVIEEGTSGITEESLLKE